MINNKKRLYRSRQDKLIAGVCGGIAEHFNVDPVWIRLIAVVLVFIDGLGILLYGILWLIMPKNPNQTNIRDKMTSKTVAGKMSLAVEKELKNEFNQKKENQKSKNKSQNKIKKTNQKTSKNFKSSIPKNQYTSKRSTTKSIIITIGVLLFNLIFVMGIFIGLLGILMGLFATAIGCIIAGILTFVLSIATFSGIQFFSLGITPIAGIFISIGITIFGILFLIADWYIAKGFYFVSAKYFNFNYRLITGRRN